MLRLPSLGELDRAVAGRIYLCTAPTDMRKGFDTLAVPSPHFSPYRFVADAERNSGDARGLMG